NIVASPVGFRIQAECLIADDRGIYERAGDSIGRWYRVVDTLASVGADRPFCNHAHPPPIARRTKIVNISRRPTSKYNGRVPKDWAFCVPRKQRGRGGAHI